MRRYSWGFIHIGVLPYALGAALVFGALVGAYFKGFANGSASRNPEFVELRTAIENSKRIALEAEKRAEEASKKVRIEYRTKVETIVQEREAARELVEVIRRETPENCVLPPAYRELWNGKPSGGSQAEPAPRVDGAPVTLADAAAAAAEAKERFERNEAKLIALQNYIAQIQEAKPVN